MRGGSSSRVARATRVACLAWLCLSPVCCQGKRGTSPRLSPSEFESLAIYDLNALREPVLQASRLAAVPHVQLGPKRTRRLLADFEYHRGNPPWKASGYLAVARTADGREFRLIISVYGAFFAVQGQRGFYDLQGSSWAEYEWDLRLALLRVFIPARMRAEAQQDASLIPVEKGGKYGYVDRSGAVAVEPRFDDVMPFSEGLAAVRVGGPDEGKWGYIDASGGFVIEPRFAGASFFSEGLAAVTVDDFFDGNQGYINRQGAIVVEPRFEVAWPFVNGVAVVSFTTMSASIMEALHINAKGQLVAPPDRR